MSTGVVFCTGTTLPFWVNEIGRIRAQSSVLEIGPWFLERMIGRDGHSASCCEFKYSIGL
jgi:hypothetical protein